MNKRVNRFIKTAVTLLIAVGMVIPQNAGIVAYAHAQDDLPEKYDLRDDGLVTPVKFQNPWGSCWAFGGVAAIESSLLSYMGETTESYKAKYGEDFDISEKHIAWFAKHPVTKDVNANQVGEGLYPAKSTDQSEYYSGGAGIMIGTLLASGIGPLMEDEFPYQGNEGITAIDYYEKNPDDVLKDLEANLGCTVKEMYEADKKDGKLAQDIKKFKDKGVEVDSSEKEITEEEFEKAYIDFFLKRTRERNCFSSHDDWTIDEKDKDGNLNRNRSDGFVLSDANNLPDPSVRDENGKWAGINEEGIRAIKKELLSGRGVSISFCADSSLPGQESKERYLNTDTWAHYTYEDKGSNHIVCIVGWDDTYSRNNFVKGHRPSGDGAWIVKNSWGSQTEYKLLKNGEKIGCNEWGVKDEDGKSTGYFYLSYYDKSADNPESMEFSATIYKKTSSIYPLAYDYMPGTNTPKAVKDRKVIKTANVFKNDSGKDLELLSMSTKAGCPNAQVLYEVYILKDDPASPEDGEFVGKRRSYYDYAGFHREDLTNPIKIKDGETFSIVTTETSVDESGKRQYEYVVNYSENKKACDEAGLRMYGVGIVNEGESYLFKNDEWLDWADVRREEINDILEEDDAADYVDTDNFSIKAYVTDELNQ